MDIDAWWSANYARYSIHDLQSVPLYHRLLQCRYPFQRTMEQQHEQFTSSSEEDVYEWSSPPNSERLSHVKSQGAYHYEHRYPESSHTVAISSWTSADCEWGEVVKTFAGWKLTEEWEVRGGNRKFKRKSEEQEMCRTVECGVREDGERWVKELWEQPGEHSFKSSWERPSQSGGECSFTSGDSSWGETWSSDLESSEQRCWHQYRDRKWGHAHGRKSREIAWEHNWDLRDGLKFDEKVTKTEGRTLGYRYTEEGGKWCKWEWEGAESPDKTVDAESLELKAIYKRALLLALQSELTIKKLVNVCPNYAEKARELGRELKELDPEKQSAGSFSMRIQRLQDLQSAQELLKQSMQESISTDWKMLETYAAGMREIANSSLETIFLQAKIAQMDEFDSEVVRVKKDTQDLAARSDLSLSEQLSAWRSLLLSMESVKQRFLPNLRAHFPTDSQSILDQTLRQQELQSCVKSAHTTFLRSFEVLWELNGIVGDEERAVVLEGLKKRFESTQNEGNVAYLRSLLAALRSFGSIESELMDAVRKGNRPQDCQPQVENAKKLVELLRDIGKMADLSEDERSHVDAAVRKVRKALGLIDSGSDLPAALTAVTEVLGIAVPKAERNARDGVTAKSALPRVAANLKSRVQPLLQTDFPEPKDPTVTVLFALLESYIDAITPAEKSENSLIANVLQDLEAMWLEMNGLTRILNQRFSDYEQRLSGLYTAAESAFQRYKQSATIESIPPALTATKAYVPLARELAHKLLTTCFSRPEDTATLASVADAMMGLEALSKELEEAVGYGDQSHLAHLGTLKGEVVAIFEEFKSSPQAFLLPRVVSAMRAYTPLLHSLSRKSKSDSPHHPYLQELQSALSDLQQFAASLDSDSLGKPALPSTDPTLEAIHALSACVPALREAVQSRIQREATSVLKNAISETCQSAIALASDDPEIMAKVQHLQEVATPQYTMTMLVSYYPLFACYWWRRGMRYFSEVIAEFDQIVAREFPYCGESLPELREKSVGIFKNYRKEYVPQNLLAAAQLLGCYHRLLCVRTPEAFVPSPDISRIPTVPTESMAIAPASPSDLKKADSLLDSEKTESISKNPILQSLQQSNVATDKPLTYLNVFKFFEELMDKKFEVDCQDLAAQRKPREMTEFLMEHLIRQFGIKSMAMRFLGQLIPGLQVLYQEGVQYAVLFARLLQVFHPDPISLPLAIFVVKVRAEFHKLMEKCAKEREIRERRKRPGTKQSVTYGRAAYDYAASGGEAFTSDTITLLYDLFDTDPGSGELALRMLRPAAVSLIDYIIFKLCHKMAKLGISPDELFRLIDSDNGGSIDENEFVNGVQSSLELWISESDIREVHKSVAANGQMSRTAFLAKCNFDWYSNAARSEDFVTTKCEFLSTLVDVYMKKQRDDTAQLLALFSATTDSLLSKSALFDLLQSLDSSNSPERMEMIWKQGLEYMQENASELSQVAFVKCMLKFPSGQFAKSGFCE